MLVRLRVVLTVLRYGSGKGKIRKWRKYMWVRKENKKDKLVRYDAGRIVSH